MFEQGKDGINWMEWMDQMDQHQYNQHNRQMFERGKGESFLAPTAPPSQEAGRNSDMVTMKTMVTMMNMTMMNMTMMNITMMTMMNMMN